jgi:putative DNA primase/helicase
MRTNESAPAETEAQERKADDNPILSRDDGDSNGSSDDRTGATAAVLNVAFALRRAGFSIIAIRRDGSKAPALKKWKKFQSRPADECTIRLWFGKRVAPGIAIVLGKVSGNAELLDVDDYDHEIWSKFKQQVFEAIPKLVDAPLVETPHGGRHLLYRVATPPPGNLKLAQRPDPQPDNPHGHKTLIETRGEGGYALTIGSPPQCHPSGNSYKLISGSFDHIPMLTDEEHLRLHELARAFDQMPPITGELEAHVPAIDGPRADGQPGRAAGTRPGDDFNRRTSWRELLERHGWRELRTLNGVGFWRRPGKKEIGHSATTNYGSSDLLYVFSSNASPFEPDRAYTKFAALALLEHGGDFPAAARQLASGGYGCESGSFPAGTEKSGVRFPFRLTDKAVEFAEERDSGDQTEWMPICSYLEVAAVTRNHEGQDWGRLLRLRDGDGGEHEWAMPMELLAGDGIDYRAQLLSRGMTMEPGKKARDRLHQYICSTMSPVRARAVARLGWHGPAFVLPDTALGDPQSEKIIYQTAYPTERSFKTKGTIDEWRDKVGSMCVGNSRLVFAVSCAFAAPLIYLTGDESGGFHFRHSSSIGKTTALRVAGSVSDGDESPLGCLVQWRATANGLESVAASHSDSLLCLDEISQVSAREAGQVAYMLANGQGKSRARRDGSGRPPASWRLLFLSSGEISLADKIREDPRARVTAGQEVRIVDIPADAGAGIGLFEDLHEFRNGQIFADRLRQVTSEAYGTPFRVFLSEITRRAARYAETARKYRDAFLVRYCPAAADGQVRRAAARFGLVSAGGELAIELDVVPWSKGEAEQAARKCFEAWIDARGGSGPAEIADGVAQVRKFLELHGQSRFGVFESAGSEDRSLVINRAGFRESGAAGSGNHFYIFPQVWKAEVCSGFDPGLIARELMDRGWLRPDPTCRKPQSVHRLPGIGPKRIYHILPCFLADTVREPGEEG